MVKQDFFSLNVRLGFISKNLLQYYSSESYRGLTDRLAAFQTAGYHFAEVTVDPFVSLKGLDFRTLSDDFLANQLSGKVLDLRNLRHKQSQYLRHQKAGGEFSQRSDPIRHLLSVIADETRYFENIADNPTATVEKVFNALGHGKKKLGFDEVKVHRPDACGRWAIDPDSCGEEGRTLFVPLKTRSGELLAIIEISSLPDNKQEAALVVTVLQLYFEKVIDAIEAVRSREMNKPAALPPAKTVVPTLQNSLWFDLQKFSAAVEPHWFYDRLTGQREPVMVMDLRGLASSGASASLLGELAIRMGLLTRNAWEINVHRPVRGYSPEHIQRRFINASRIFLAGVEKEGGVEIIGFSVVNELRDPQLKLKKKALLYDVSMVEQRFQGMGITSYLVGRMFTEALLANNFKPVMVAARTANPQAFGGLQVLGGVFPRLGKGTKPTADQKTLFNYVAQQLSPGLETDQENFVIRGAFGLSDGFVAPPHLIPQHGDPEINELCEKLLDYQKFNTALFYPGELAPDLFARLASELGLVPDVDLNREVLENPRFYGSLIAPRLVADSLMALVRHTAAARQGEFAALDKDMQENIRVLNRLLLEELYPWLPKRRGNALLVIGKISIFAKLSFSLKQFKKGAQRRLKSFIRRQIIGSGANDQ